jgi:hypothetical protein
VHRANDPGMEVKGESYGRLTGGGVVCVCMCVCVCVCVLACLFCMREQVEKVEKVYVCSEVSSISNCTWWAAL